MSASEIIHRGIIRKYEAGIKRPGFRLAQIAGDNNGQRQFMVDKLIEKIITPLFCAGKLIIGWKSGQQREIVRRAGAAIEIMKNVHQRDRLEIVAILAKAVNNYDHETFKHQERVKGLCVKMAVLVGLGRAEKQDLAIAARLHDFGKIGIPIQILGSKTKFTSTGVDIIDQVERAGEEEELKRLQELKELHLMISLWVFGEVPWLKGPLEILRYNHAYDGYPRESKPQDMSLAAQILSAADIYDALTVKRPYSDQMFPEEALALIGKRAYDPTVLMALRNAVSSK